MKNKVYPNRSAAWVILPYLALILAIGTIIWLYFENKRQQTLLLELLSQNATKGKDKSADAYISGPVKNRILKGYSDIQKCYKAYLEKNPTIREGKIRVDWLITTSGKVLNPEVVLSDIPDESFKNCLITTINRWEFPKPLIDKYVEHTFKFNEVEKK